MPVGRTKLIRLSIQRFGSHGRSHEETSSGSSDSSKYNERSSSSSSRRSPSQQQQQRSDHQHKHRKEQISTSAHPVPSVGSTGDHELQYVDRPFAVIADSGVLFVLYHHQPHSLKDLLLRAPDLVSSFNAQFLITAQVCEGVKGRVRE